MWISSSLILKLTLNLSWYNAFLIGACVTPTDPVLANGIVKGRFADNHLPRFLRDIISAESGANDGLGLPFVFLVVYLNRFTDEGVGFGWWFLKVFIYQIGMTIVLAVILGLLARKTLKAAQNFDWTDKESILGFSISLALLVIGLFSRLGLDEILGCFVVGIFISYDEWFNKQIEMSHIQEVLDTVLNVTFFIFIGTLIPWDLIAHNPSFQLWQLVLAGLLIIGFRRLPFVLAFKPLIPALTSWKEAFFCGWFGPIGAGAIFCNRRN